jgi:hypothetical protein
MNACISAGGATVDTVSLLFDAPSVLCDGVAILAGCWSIGRGAAKG